MLKKLLATVAALFIAVTFAPPVAHPLDNTEAAADGYVNISNLTNSAEIDAALDERLFALQGKQSEHEIRYLAALPESIVLVADDGQILSAVVPVKGKVTAGYATVGIWWLKSANTVPLS
ncbi:hypothetical protein [Canibacter oris]|uniref:Uncharacterized protein n=1 Tax=Canibacter oris TaxID=1365628 RepID=A0A840DED3_9MICO|nr:hypothetical protein [Canibacter oris]MBB4071801.1 hypothetical protein [Canibacter oris]